MNISKVMIIGSGQMGSGIAQVFAQSGFTVYLNDIKDEFVERGIGNITKQLTRSVEKGRLSEADKNSILSKLIPSTSYEDAKNVQLVIEAATENRDIKLSIFKQLDELTTPETILASNTSSLSITDIAAATVHQERVIGMHFFNPADRMKLVEVIAGANTPKELVEKIKAIATEIGKTPVEVNEAAGFVVNRILIPMINEAINVYAAGVASVKDIDVAMQLGANHPMGPLALGDYIGLDIVLAIMEVIYAETGDSKYAPSPLLRKMVRAGKLGKKTGAGFYDYSK